VLQLWKQWPFWEAWNSLNRLVVLRPRIESDSLKLIQACNGDTEVCSPYTAMLVDCFQKASRMELVILQHCLLDANMVAHNLSKVAYEMKVNIFLGW
jgi:hypothetical protein